MVLKLLNNAQTAVSQRRQPVVSRAKNGVTAPAMPNKCRSPFQTKLMTPHLSSQPDSHCAREGQEENKLLSRSHDSCPRELHEKHDFREQLSWAEVP
ncbi:unnamed protein product [Protopolystoma xenopodis]|uniref:Uncharacterized protein n=1 Tax=Protopolystoma xenopodis TaxID=117903 RepID=A0A448XFB6_9PLAT|nr:unnamed protein product [Protopolystoma xenopodis]